MKSARKKLAGMMMAVVLSATVGVGSLEAAPITFSLPGNSYNPGGIDQNGNSFAITTTNVAGVAAAGMVVFRPVGSNSPIAVTPPTDQTAVQFVNVVVSNNGLHAAATGVRSNGTTFVARWDWDGTTWVNQSSVSGTAGGTIDVNAIRDDGTFGGINGNAPYIFNTTVQDQNFANGGGVIMTCQVALCGGVVGNSTGTGVDPALYNTLTNTFQNLGSQGGANGYAIHISENLSYVLTLIDGQLGRYSGAGYSLFEYLPLFADSGFINSDGSVYSNDTGGGVSFWSTIAGVETYRGAVTRLTGTDIGFDPLLLSGIGYLGAIQQHNLLGSWQVVTGVPNLGYVANDPPSGAVPEPGTVGLLGSALAALIAGRKRQEIAATVRGWKERFI